MSLLVVETGSLTGLGLHWLAGEFQELPVPATPQPWPGVTDACDYTWLLCGCWVYILMSHASASGTVPTKTSPPLFSED